MKLILIDFLGIEFNIIPSILTNRYDKCGISILISSGILKDDDDLLLSFFSFTCFGRKSFAVICGCFRGSGSGILINGCFLVCKMI